MMQNKDIMSVIMDMKKEIFKKKEEFNYYQVVRKLKDMIDRIESYQQMPNRDKHFNE